MNSTNKPVIPLSIRWFYGYVFITGAAVMMLEFTASRLLAPWFGTSQLVWGNVIGVILIALSLGYYIGGRLADRRPETNILLTLTMIAGLLACIAPLLAQWLASQFNLLALATGGGSALHDYWILYCDLYLIRVTRNTTGYGQSLCDSFSHTNLRANGQCGW